MPCTCAISSVGRAIRLHRKGQGFESLTAHKKYLQTSLPMLVSKLNLSFPVAALRTVNQTYLRGYGNAIRL